MRSGLVVPITAPGPGPRSHHAGLGRVRRRFTEADLGLAEETAARAGLAIENARLYQERDHIAATLQRALLPPALPEIPGHRAARLLPPGPGGLPGGRRLLRRVPGRRRAWLLVIGDARGKGPEAAAVTALVRYIDPCGRGPRAEPGAHPRPRERDAAGSLEVEDFATVAIVRVEPVREGIRLTASSAGHPRPAILRRDGALTVVGKPGLILGAFTDGDWTDAVARVPRGDTAVLYTDGLTSKDEGDSMAEGSRLRGVLQTVAGAEAAQVLRVIREHVTSEARATRRTTWPCWPCAPSPSGNAASSASVMSDSERVGELHEARTA